MTMSQTPSSDIRELVAAAYRRATRDRKFLNFVERNIGKRSGLSAKIRKGGVVS